MSGFAGQADELNVKGQGRVGWNNAPKATFTYPGVNMKGDRVG